MADHAQDLPVAGGDSPATGTDPAAGGPTLPACPQPAPGTVMAARWWLTPAGEAALDALIAGRADSRAAGLAVLRSRDPRVRHDPRCAGCHGDQTSATCPYSTKQRRAAQGAGDG